MLLPSHSAIFRKVRSPDWNLQTLVVKVQSLPLGFGSITSNKLGQWVTDVLIITQSLFVGNPNPAHNSPYHQAYGYGGSTLVEV
jgi:hypothetical protein